MAKGYLTMRLDRTPNPLSSPYFGHASTNPRCFALQRAYAGKISFCAHASNKSKDPAGGSGNTSHGAASLVGGGGGGFVGCGGGGSEDEQPLTINNAIDRQRFLL